MEDKVAEICSVTEKNVADVPMLDYFITALSCDKRGACVFNMLAKNKKIKTTITFDYKKHRPDCTSSELLEIYHGISASQIILADYDDSDVSYLNSQSMDENDIIGIDITNFCIPDLFRIMFVLKKIKSVKKIYAFYTEPKFYLQHYNIWNDTKSMNQERDYKVLDEYFVSSVPDKTLLVCFLGFEYLVSKYVSESANTKDTVVVNGFPSYFPKLKDISLANNYELVSTLSKKNIYCAKANDPFSSYNTLMAIHEKYPNYVLNLCVLGTKPMALGACMFALENETSVKVSYPEPKIYPKATSKEASDMWYYII